MSENTSENLLFWHGLVLGDLAGPDMLNSRLLDKFRTFRVQKWYFDEISKWFCIIFAGEAKKSRYLNQEPYYLTQNQKNIWKIKKI